VIDKIAIGFFGEAPRLLEPGFEFVFLSVFLTVSGLICST
jgi:hypothetical protein